MYKKITYLLSLLAVITIFAFDADTMKEQDELYRKFIPLKTVEPHAKMQFSHYASYIVKNRMLPRVFMIADNRTWYRGDLRKEMENEIHFIDWVTTRSIAEKEFFRELSLHLNKTSYVIIVVKMGANSFHVNTNDFKAAYCSMLEYLSVAQPNAKILLCTMTPNTGFPKKEPERNAVIREIAKEKNLPLIELSNTRENKLHASLSATEIRKFLKNKKNSIERKYTGFELGPDGMVKY